MNGIEGPKVIHIDGELYYHSEWLKTRHKIIERLEEENNRLREERDSFQRVGIRTLEKLEQAELVFKAVSLMCKGIEKSENIQEMVDGMIKHLQED